MFTAKTFYGNPRAVETGPRKDVDTPSRNEVLVFPDADVSDPEVEESFEVEAIIEPESEQSSDSSDSGEEETSQPSIFPARNNSSSKRAKITWKALSAADKKSEIPEFNGPSNCFEDSLLNPIQYFSKHWTNAMSDFVATESNLFCVAK